MSGEVDGWKEGQVKDSDRQKDKQRWERKERVSLLKKHPRHVKASPWGLKVIDGLQFLVVYGNDSADAIGVICRQLGLLCTDLHAICCGGLFKVIYQLDQLLVNYLEEASIYTDTKQIYFHPHQSLHSDIAGAQCLHKMQNWYVIKKYLVREGCTLMWTSTQTHIYRHTHIHAYTHTHTHTCILYLY